MKQIPYTNHKPHAVTIGTKTIAPNDTRMVDASLVPELAGAKPKAPAAKADPIQDALDAKATEARTMLAALSDEQLAALAEREERKTVKAAIQEEQLERAKHADTIEALREFSDEELAEQAESEENETVLAAIKQLQAERAEAEDTGDGE